MSACVYQKIWAVIVTFGGTRVDSPRRMTNDILSYGTVSRFSARLKIDVCPYKFLKSAQGVRGQLNCLKEYVCCRELLVSFSACKRKLRDLAGQATNAVQPNTCCFNPHSLITFPTGDERADPSEVMCLRPEDYDSAIQSIDGTENLIHRGIQAIERPQPVTGSLLRSRWKVTSTIRAMVAGMVVLMETSPFYSYARGFLGGDHGL